MVADYVPRSKSTYVEFRVKAARSGCLVAAANVRFPPKADTSGPIGISRRRA